MECRTDIAAFAIFILSVLKLSNGSMFGGNDRLLLQDLKVLTLLHGQMTTARRSDPIPQLRCMGGSAQCSFTPTTVQCYNKGSDGFDVQWECKTDMDNSHRFGKVEVSCEGYDYPDDPYVLRGSCGLEYTIDYTKDGYQKHKHNHKSSYGSNSQYYSGNNYSSHKKHSSWFGDLITLGIVGAIIYGIYKTCLNDDHSAGGRASAGGHDQYRGSGGNPPPPGFRSEYMPDGCSSSSYGQGYGTNYGRRGTGGSWFGNTGGFGGFWGGAATGGMLGYLLGNRNRGYGYGSTYTHHQPHNTGWGFGGGNSWGSGATGSSWGGGGGAPSFGSSGTRTASGFGGTKRR